MTTSSECARGVVWECLAWHARNIESFAAGLQTGSLLESDATSPDRLSRVLWLLWHRRC
ncbi:protein of unknown function [Methylorubrum extorquens]|uniref:Uncharacterized protein n=1 Tax=Methylorubrum extorquens TaxID=408 RepID=A0A2N9AVE6_METEX|nr:protein of unknown function [Methylorubrum extorquens]